MSDRPSDGWDIDDLRDEFDWIIEFQSRMAERIRGDADVHNLVDYVGKLESENARLRELASLNWEWAHSCCGDGCKLRTDECGYGIDRECNYEREIYDRMRELGVEV